MIIVVMMIMMIQKHLLSENVSVAHIWRGCGPEASQGPKIDYNTCSEAKSQTHSGLSNGCKMLNAAK
jgi:hypothetical protein